MYKIAEQFNCQLIELNQELNNYINICPDEDIIHNLNADTLAEFESKLGEYKLKGAALSLAVFSDMVHNADPDSLYYNSSSVQRFESVRHISIDSYQELMDKSSSDLELKAYTLCLQRHLLWLFYKEMHVMLEQYTPEYNELVCYFRSVQSCEPMSFLNKGITHKKFDF